MINEERVKELFHMAVYDEYEEKKYRQMNEYYMWDYVGKELVKSFFTGTIAFVLLAGLWALKDLTGLVAYVNNADFLELGFHIIVFYIVFLTVYMLVTAIIYCVRYVRGRKRLRKYVEHLKKVKKLYKGAL